MIGMKLLRRCGPITAGLLVLSAGLAVGYGWLYKLSPMRRLTDPVWCAQHSEAARWAEEQKDYRRMGRAPDLCFLGDRIGFYGNKEWFLWLVEQARHPDRFRVCGCTEYALALMANRHIGSWAVWAEGNRGHSQEEWIREGFLAQGVMVHLPPQPDDTLPLLKLLGRKSWNFLWAGPQGTNMPEAVPSYVHYNAYRWLRDSGFDARKFALSNAVLVATAEVAGGLVNYSQWLAAYPGEAGAGVLALGGNSARDPKGLRPPLASPWLNAGVNALMVVLVVAGVAMLRRSLPIQ